MVWASAGSSIGVQVRRVTRVCGLVVRTQREFGMITSRKVTRSGEERKTKQEKAEWQDLRSVFAEVGDGKSDDL